MSEDKIDEVRKALLLMKKKGYLENKKSRLGEEFWVDSKDVKQMLSEGKNRVEIHKILEERWENKGVGR